MSRKLASKRLFVKLCGNNYGMIQTPGAFSPIDLYISQTIRDAFQRLDLGVTAFGKTISSPISKVVQDRLSPVL